MEVMKDLRIEEDEMLVSFDKSSLFMNVPVAVLESQDSVGHSLQVVEGQGIG